jgi:hypothetical protein
MHLLARVSSDWDFRPERGLTFDSVFDETTNLH